MSSTVTITRFDGGMAGDIRSRASNQCALCRHFDIYTNPYRLTPYGGMQADTSGQTAIGNIQVGSDGVLYGLGTDQAFPTHQDIYVKSNTTDPTSAWTEVSSSKSGKDVNYNCFVEYKGYWYTADTNRYIMRFDRTGSASTNPTYSDLTSFTSVAQGIVHPKDDILYIPYDNKIWALNGHGGTPALGALSAIPSNRTIAAIAPYGNYLAIATNPTTPGAINQNAIVYLWDRDQTLNTVTESIDFGNGSIKALNNLDGVLIAVSTAAGNSMYGRSFNSLQIRAYAGGAPVMVSEISSLSVTLNSIVSFVNSNRMYFAAKMADAYSSSSSDTFPGVWSISKNKLGQYAVAIERVATSDNSDYANYPLAAAVVKDYASIVYSDYGTLSITKSSATDFSGTSEYRSLVNHGMPEVDRFKLKKLVAVSVTFVALDTDAQVVLKYRTDPAVADSWTTIFTKTASSPNTELTGYESTTANGSQFTTAREFQFQVLSTNGAEITGIAYTYEVIKSAI